MWTLRISLLIVASSSYRVLHACNIQLEGVGIFAECSMIGPLYNITFKLSPAAELIGTQQQASR